MQVFLKRGLVIDCSGPEEDKAMKDTNRKEYGRNGNQCWREEAEVARSLHGIDKRKTTYTH